MLKNLSTGIEASATGESFNSGDPAVHPATRHIMLYVCTREELERARFVSWSTPSCFIKRFADLVGARSAFASFNKAFPEILFGHDGGLFYHRLTWFSRFFAVNQSQR